MKVTIALALFSVSATAAILTSGGNSSGGGFVVRDEMNPWYLQNTKELRYCIESSREFKQSRARLAELIHLAFGYWKDEFKSKPETTRPKLGTQKLVLENKCGKALLRFQFGALTKSQRKLVGDPRDFVGVAIRTEYDPKYLRAKGFIYISPDHGPNRYRGSEYIDKAWSVDNGARLYFLLVHELGHIFGIPDLGVHKRNGSVMSHDFPTKLVEKNLNSIYKDFRTKPDFLVPEQHTHIVCGIKGTYEASTLGMTENCIKLDWVKSDPFSQILRPQFSVANSRDATKWRILGVVWLSSGFGDALPLNFRIKTFVTDQNKVFNLNGKKHKFFYGRSLFRTIWRGFFVKSGSTPRNPEFSISSLHEPNSITFFFPTKHPRRRVGRMGTLVFEAASHRVNK